MVNVTVRYKTHRAGSCGSLRNYVNYALPSSDMKFLIPDCEEFMEDFEDENDDAYEISFEENGLNILRITNDNGIWYRYENDVLITHGERKAIFPQ